MVSNISILKTLALYRIRFFFLNGPIRHCMQKRISCDGKWPDTSPVDTLITSDFLFCCGPQFLTEFKEGKFIKDTILCCVVHKPQENCITNTRYNKRGPEVNNNPYIYIQTYTHTFRIIYDLCFIYRGPRQHSG